MSWVSIVVLAALLGVLRWLFPERPMDYVGPRALLDAAFALGLLGLTLLVAGGIGRKVQRWLKLEGWTRLERAVFGLSIGLGVLAYGVLALGLVRSLQPWAILLLLTIVAVWTWRELTDIVTALPSHLAVPFRGWREIGLGERLLSVAGGLIFVLTLLQALTPPWDTDGLMYHLQGPKLFLQAERILLLPDNWQANGPFTVEMLYAIGMAFGSDTYARLMHLTYAVLLVLGTFALGQRLLKSKGGWIAVAILVGNPIFPVWASLAYADMAWALFEFLGLYALILWVQSTRRYWLVLAGVMTGLALGSKYLALGGAAALGLWVLWHCRTRGWQTVLRHCILFGGTALLVGSPWYVKNWLWTGNPVYPVFFGGTGWTMDRVSWHTAYHRGFGAGHSVWDYLLLPWNLYAQYGQFGTFGGSIEIPSLLFSLVPLYPWARRSRMMDGVAWIALFRFAAWSLGSHQTRHLLPIFPVLSLLASSVLVSLMTRPVSRRWGRVLAMGLVGGVVTVTLLYSITFFASVQPLAVISGMESKDAFLRRMTGDYSALQFVKANLSPQARVLMMWDARGYYCDDRCLPDAEHSRWTRLVSSMADASSIAASLRAMGITHLLFSIDDADFILQHDPTGQHRDAAEFFLQEFRQSCTEEIYRDEKALLFELTCP
jgi:hypothetical protein